MDSDLLPRRSSHRSPRRRDQITELGQPGTILGPFEEPVLRTCSRKLLRGDDVVLYTDGVTDARSAEGFFGEARLHEAMGRYRGSAHGLAYGLLDEVTTYQGGVTADDIVIVAVHIP